MLQIFWCDFFQKLWSQPNYNKSALGKQTRAHTEWELSHRLDNVNVVVLLDAASLFSTMTIVLAPIGGTVHTSTQHPRAGEPPQPGKGYTGGNLIWQSLCLPRSVCVCVCAPLCGCRFVNRYKCAQSERHSWTGLESMGRGGGERIRSQHDSRCSSIYCL